MQRAEQARRLRELAAEFHNDTRLLSFSCAKVGDISLDLRKEYGYLFGLEDVGLISPPNTHELWTEMTPTVRRNQRVMMLLFMAAIIEKE